MILVDISVWVDHLNLGEPLLRDSLDDGEVAMHPFVLGELACGSIRNREEVLGLLTNLPAIGAATDQEAIHFIEGNGLMGKGLGYIDIHLLAATRLAAIPLWTRDSRLARIGESWDSLS